MRDDLNAKYRLKNGVCISIKTTMIGALAIFEEYFEEEIKADPERWGEVREEILNRGHECMDIAAGHLNKYNVGFKNLFIPFTKKGRTNG